MAERAERLDCFLPPVTVHRCVSLKAEDEHVPYNIEDYDIPNFWDLCDAGAGITVGVADTGAPTSHMERSYDMYAKVLEAKDFTNSTTGEEDRQGHGCVAPTDRILTSLCGLQEIQTFFDRADGMAHFLPDRAVVKDVSRRNIFTLSLDRQGRTVRRRVLAVHKLPYNGPVLRVQCSHSELPLTVTPWHPVYVQTSSRGMSRTIVRKRADQLKSGERLVLSGDNEGVTDDYVDMPLRRRWVCTKCGHEARGGKRKHCRKCNARSWHEGPTTTSIRLDETFAYWLGLVCSDGHRMQSSYSVEYMASLAGEQEAGYLVDVFNQLCEQLFERETSEYPCRTNARRVRLHDVDVWHLLERLGVPAGAKSQILEVPELLAKSPRSVAFAFIAGYLDGNGSQSTDERTRVATGSRAFAEQLTLLYRMLGGRASWSECPARTREFPGGHVSECGPSYSVRLGRHPQLAKWSRWKQTAGEPRTERRSARIETIEEQDYDGYMYDLTVEGSHNYACNGQIVSNTHVAGTIAARYDNNRGIVGVAHGISGLYTAKVLGDNGSGSNRGVADGIRWLVDQGVHIINLSLGSPHPDELIKRACEYARDNGVLVVAAAGNEGGGRDTVGYPANWDYLAVAVGAVDKNKQLARFSSTGPAVDVVGPGVRIRSLYLRRQLAELSGTSMATPWVVACFALRMAYLKKRGQPERITVPEALGLLEKTCDDLGRGGLDPQFGWGVPRVRQLITHGVEPSDPEEPNPPQPEPEPQPEPGLPQAKIPGIVNGRHGHYIFVED